MLDQSYYAKADEIMDQYGRKPASLIPIMQEIQGAYRYLPGELLSYVADKIGVTEAKAFSVRRSMRTFPSTQRESMLSRYVTEQPVMCGNPCRYWRPCMRSWA